MAVFVTGPSGVGKSFLTQTYYTSKEISPILSVNTRPLRPLEKEKNRTISKRRFDTFLDRGDLCLIAENHGNYYAYIKAELDAFPGTLVLELDSATAIREKETFQADIVRIIPSFGAVAQALENLYNKRDHIQHRLMMYHKEMHYSFLNERKRLGDIIFENNFDADSIRNFMRLVKTLGA